MKAALILSTLILSGLAHAETFTCSFTEPFVTETYNTVTQQLVINDISTTTNTTIKNVTFQITALNTFVLADANGKTLSVLVLNNQGADGMSNNVYPYSVTTNTIGGPNSGIGGCSSERLPVKNVN